ncbi:MAG: FAD-dependent oxidoreductase [Chloroflexi bacterium]|nr:FAD-dependent oxidoreductase [Chloroflexota bacterium]
MVESFEFKHLFSPITIGPITLRNRLMTTAHEGGFVEPGPATGEPGHHGERYAYYFAERAKGGIGLIIDGVVQVHPTSAYKSPGFMGGAWDTKNVVPGFRLATQMIHEHGAKVFIQLGHAGADNTGIVSWHPPLAPSSVVALGGVGFKETSKAMEIEEIIEYFGIGAENARTGGFDGIEIHAGTSYLIHQFLSPLWNHRTDEWGGSLENRMRFMLRVIDRVSRVTRNDMALGMRLTIDDLVPAGLSFDEMKEVARRLEATGKVHFIDVNVGHHGPFLVNPTMYEPHGVMVRYSAALKKVVNIPVVAVGRIVDPREGEKILAEGQADLIGMTRAHIADPEIANKAREGRLDEIRLCTGCCQLCIGVVPLRIPMSCTQNPAVGREKTLGIGTLKMAPKTKRVLVIGGGVGGMEAAWIAAARGHHVTLYEKSLELGGQMNLAALLPGRGENRYYVDWRKTMLKKHGVNVVLGKETTAQDVLREASDAVVVATGSTPRRDGLQQVTGAPIPGWDLPHVTVVDEILLGKVKVGQKVLILDEENFIKAPALADMLTRQGKDVEIIDRHYFMGSELDPITRNRVYRVMAERGFRFTPQSSLLTIEEDGATVINLANGATRKVEADTVVLVTGRIPNEDLYFALKGKVKELHRVGDCVAPRWVHAPIRDGHKVGREL